MKGLVTLIWLLVFATQCHSQVFNPDDFNHKRIQIIKNSSAILGIWGAANIIYSGIATSSSNGSEMYFYKMNLIWGSVNFLIGTAGYIFLKNKDGLSYSQSLKKQMSIEKLYLFNTGLDVAYIVGGFYFKAKASTVNVNHDKNKGYGESIVLQGSALLLYDGTLSLIHQAHGKKLYALLDKFRVGFTGSSIDCVVFL